MERQNQQPQIPYIPELPYAPYPEVLPPGAKPEDGNQPPQPQQQGSAIDHSDAERMRRWNEQNKL